MLPLRVLADFVQWGLRAQTQAAISHKAQGCAGSSSIGEGAGPSEAKSMDPAARVAHWHETVLAPAMNSQVGGPWKLGRSSATSATGYSAERGR